MGNNKPTQYVRTEKDFNVEFKVGQTVRMNSQHPWSDYTGTIIAIEEIRSLKRRRPRVRLSNGHEVFIMSDNDATII